jgi:uncharacterized protein YecE (DUF72 family)
MVVIGTQGWNYDAWIGPFYPRGARQDDMLGMYAKLFGSVEVDATFYAPPTEATIRGWVARTPDDFTFALKLPRSITHENRLHDTDRELRVFCDRARGLGKKLAAVLIQFPPDFSPRETDLLARFLPNLPTDIRFAIEFRDRRWMTEDMLTLLGAHDVALALVDGEWIPREMFFDIADQPTASFSYVRWMGPRSITDHSRVQLERDEELEEWAGIVSTVGRRVETVLAYFSNFYQGHAPASANHLKRLLGQSEADPDSLVKQPSLF